MSRPRKTNMMNALVQRMLVKSLQDSVFHCPLSRSSLPASGTNRPQNDLPIHTSSLLSANYSNAIWKPSCTVSAD